MRPEQKLHLAQETPNLNQRLSRLGAQYSGTCVIFDSTFGQELDLSLSFVGEDPNYLWVRAVFSKPPANLSTASFTITGPITAHSLSGQDRSFVFVLQKTGFGQASISIATNTVADEAGEFFPATGPIIRDINARPIPVITGPTQVSVGTTQLTITFNEDVTGLSIADFVVTGGSVNSLVGSGDSYTFNLEVASIQTEVQVVLPAGVCQAANLSTNVDSNIYAPVTSKGPLTATVKPTKAIFSTFLTTFLIEWNADVDDSFSQQDLSVNTGTITGFTKITPSKFLVNVTVTEDTTVTLTVVAETVTLLGYDPNLAASGSCQVSTTALTFTLVPPTGWLNGEAVIEVIANGPHSGLLASDFVVQNGVVLDWSPVGNGGSLTVAPTSYGREVVLAVSIPAGVAVNPAGLENNAAGPVQVFHDSLPPAITFVSFTRIGDEYEFAFRTSEIVVRVLDYSHPESSSTVFTGEGLNWVVRVNPIADKGNLQINFPAGLFADKAYNVSAAVSSPVYPFDTVGPVGDWQLVADGHAITRVTNKKNRAFILTFDSQLSAELTIDKLTTSTGLVVSGLEVIQPRRVYRVSTVNSGLTGIAQLSLPVGSVRDMFDNINTTASTVNWDFDFVKPVVSDWSATVDERNVLFVIEFNENVSRNVGNFQVLTQNLTVLDVTFSSRIITVSTTVNSSTPSNNLQVGIALPQNFVLDIADNGNDQTIYFTTIVDTAGPTVTITSPQHPQTSSQLVTFGIESSDPLSSDLVRSQLQLVNATLDPLSDLDTSFVINTPGRVYTATVRAVQDGEVRLTVPANILLDLDGNPNSQGSLTVLVGSRFNLTLAFSAGSKPDTRVLTVSSSIAIDQSSLTVSDINPSEGALSVEAGDSFNRFVIQLNPALTTARATIPSGEVLSTTGRVNNQATQQTSYAAMLASAIMTSTTQQVRRNVDIPVDITWNIRVQRFTVADLKIGIRNVDLQIITGTGFVGNIVGLTTIEPGYKFRAICRVSEFPSNLQERLHIWHDATVNGTADMANRRVTDQAFISLPFVDPLVSTFSSPDSPSTTKRLITFVVTFNSDLAQNLTQQDFTIINGAIGAAYPGSSFTVSPNGRQYTLVVYALAVDDVTVILANDVAQGAQGQFVQGGELTVVWLGLENFFIEWVTAAGEYRDSFDFHLVVEEGIDLDYDQVTVDSLVFNSNLMKITKLPGQNAAFTAIRIPSLTVAVFEAPAGVYESADGRRNNKATGVRSLLAFLGGLTITTETSFVVYDRDLVFTITSNTKINGTIDPNDLEFGLRDSLYNPVPGFNQDGELVEFVEVVPGYRWTGRYRLDGQITTTAYPFYIWYTNNGNDTVNYFNQPIPSGARARLQVLGVFAAEIWNSTPAAWYPYPAILTFDIRFNQDLAVELTTADFDIVNGNVHTSSPSNGFVTVTSKRHYKVYVRPITTGNVTVSIAAGEVASVTGARNTAAEATASWTWYFQLTGQITPTAKADQFMVTLNVPEGTILPDAMAQQNALSTNSWVAEKIYVPNTFQWILRVHPATGPTFNTSEPRQIQISINRNVFVTDNGSRNEPYVFPAYSFTVVPNINLTVETDPLSTGENFVVRVKSNTYFVFDPDSNPSQNILGLGIICYCGFVDVSGFDPANYLASIPGLTLSGDRGYLQSTEVDENYEYTWAFQLTAISPPKRIQYSNLITYGHRDQVNVQVQVGFDDNNQPIYRFSQEAYLAIVNSVIGDFGARPLTGGLLLSNGAIYLVQGDKLHKPVVLDITKHLVEFDWLGDVYATFRHAFHNTLLNVFPRYKTRSIIVRVRVREMPAGTAQVITVDWGDGEIENITASQAVNTGVTVPNELEFWLSHVYPDASLYTASIEAVSSYTTITTLCEARVRANGTLTRVRPTEISLNQIVAIRENPNRDKLKGLEEVCVSQNLTGMLSVVSTAEDKVVKSLKAYTGYLKLPEDYGIFNFDTNPNNPFQERLTVGGVTFAPVEYLDIATTHKLHEALGLSTASLGANTDGDRIVNLHDSKFFSNTDSGHIGTFRYTTNTPSGSPLSHRNVRFQKADLIELNGPVYWRIELQIPPPAGTTHWLKSAKEIIIQNSPSFILDELSFDPRSIGTRIYRITNTQNVSLRIDWRKNLAQANTLFFPNANWPSNTELGVRLVHIINHQMSYQEELAFFTRLEGMLNTLVNTSGAYSRSAGFILPAATICEIYLKRVGGINPQTPDDIMHNNAILQSITNIAIYSQQANAPNVFRITRE
jgi:hypothetical protein